MKPRHLILALTLSLVGLLPGCSSERATVAPPTSFDAYREATRDLVAATRSFQSADQAAEIGYNTPQEWRPAIQPAGMKAERGILLVHGLGDSPFSFSDVGPRLARQGFLVRSLLLPGHGTDPAHLIDVSADDWRRVVAEQTTLLKRDAGAVYLGGFSTGANLVTALALADPDIDGLLLFSPGFRSDEGYEWMAPLLAPFVTWLREPDVARPQQNPVRYLNVPTNGFGQFHRTSSEIRNALDAQPFDRPATIILAENDSVLDVKEIAATFAQRFTHPDSRLIWYGSNPLLDDDRILVRPDYLPEYRISQFSHMSVLFSPGNPLYGRDGSLRFCQNGQNPDFHARCMRGEEVWFSDWGFEMPDRVHARLTFNPYFDWQMQVAGAVLGAEGPRPLNDQAATP
ncbi:MAG: alpha/beta fold hydrolase [Rhodospirillaceae bacterium]|nr:alpha/beta fold hydrolase [Rhodospirillaceae bacterium]